MKKISNYKYYLAVFISLITFIIYLPTLRNEFIEWDDRYYIFTNPFIRSFNTVFFKRAFLGFYQSNWHPLTWMSHALDYAVWGLNPFGHHLTNNVLHAVNAFLVVFVITRLLEAARERTARAGVSEFLTERTTLIAGGVAGLLFGLHPLHVESVAWVSERKDLLCALFFLLSIIQYTNYVRSEGNETASRKPSSFLSNKYYLLTLVFFILALLSKPMAVTLPVVLLILDWYPLNRIPSMRTVRSAAVEKLPFFASSLMSSILTILAQRAGGAIRSLEAAPLSIRLLVAAKSLILYLWKMIWPLNLVQFYPYPDLKKVSLLSFEYLSVVALVIGITIACIVVAKKQRVWLTAWGYYIVTLLPAIGIIRVGGQSIADRYTYLPSLGPFLVMGLGAAWIFNKAYARKKSGLTVQFLGAIMGIFIFVAISFLTVKQIGIWENSFVFWNYFLANKEKEAVGLFPYVNLGMAFEDKQLLDQAIEQYRIAVRLAPGDVDAHNDLGVAYDEKGLLDQAIEQYQIVLKLNPNSARGHNNLGEAYKKKNLLDRAIEQYQIASRLDPDYALPHVNLGDAYRKKELLDQAIEQYLLAIGLQPDHALAHNNLGEVYAEKGWQNQAIEQYQIAVRSETDFALARNNLAHAYEKNGLITQAIEQYQIIVKQKPDYAVAHNHLGEAYQKKGLVDQAIEQYQIALRLRPDDFDAHSNLGVAYKEKSMKDQALSQFRIALKLKPESPLAHNNLGTAYGMLGLTDQAIEQFRIAVKLDPQNPTWRKNLALAYGQRGAGR